MAGHNRISQQQIEDMRTYRELGLSNQQIAIEMGLSRATINRYIGKQPDNVRSQYGSIIAHTKGESYVKQEIQPKKKSPILSVVRSRYEFKGAHFSYWVDSKGAVVIRKRDDCGENFQLSANKEEFNALLIELTELNNKLTLIQQSQDKLLP